MTFTPDGGRQPFSDRFFRSTSGVWAQFTESASLHRLDVGNHSVLMYPSDDLEAGPANLYLRLHQNDGVAVTPLLGPASPGEVGWSATGPEVRGTWRDLTFRVRFVLAETDTAWFWHVEVINGSAQPATVDIVQTQDVALAPYSELRVNEYYVAQYLDLTPIQTRTAGTAIAVRQKCRPRTSHGCCSAVCARQWRGAPTRSRSSGARASTARRRRDWRPTVCPARASSTSTRLRCSRTAPNSSRRAPR